jgi:hypothetical protein
MKRIFAFVLGLVLYSASAFAQGATPTYQTATMYNVCNVQATATGVANTSVVATVPAQGGYFFNVCSMEFTVVANAAVTGAAAPAQLYTTTGLATNLIFWGNNTTLVIGDSRDQNHYYALPLQTTTAGTAFVVTGTGGQASQTIRINVTGFYSRPPA